MALEIEYDIKFPPEIRGPSKEAEYLMQDGNMEGRYLGQCLDNCRWGGLTTIMYEMNSLQMMQFIRNWMKQNEGNLKFHYENPPSDFELPYVNREVCPRNSKHKLRNIGLDGTVRCIDEDLKEIKEGYLCTDIFFDPWSESRRKEYWEWHPRDEDDEAWEEYENTTNTITVKEKCGAILSDRGVTLPLAEILDRLNVFSGRLLRCETDLCGDPLLKEFDLERECFGHLVYDHYILPFDGWYLAWYAQKWYEQPPKGSSPFTTPKITEKLIRKVTTPDIAKTMMKKLDNLNYPAAFSF